MKFNLFELLQMGLHLDCPQRRWQTIDYEVNWELQPHSSESIFSEHSCNVQKTVMEEYEKVKMQMWGKLSNYNHTT